MPTLKESAMNYVPTQIKTVADLPQVSVDVEILFNPDAEFPYHYIQINGDEYKVPDSVRRDLQTILKENPNLKAFKVKKTGEGLKTRYTIITLQ